MVKFEEVWDYLSGYTVYAVGALIAIFIDTIATVLSFILYLPTANNISLQTYVEKGNVGMQHSSEFIIRVIDGRLFLWDLSVNEILQQLLLLVTLIVAVSKAVIDLKDYIEKRKTKKNRANARKRRKED